MANEIALPRCSTGTNIPAQTADCAVKIAGDKTVKTLIGSKLAKLGIVVLIVRKNAYQSREKVSSLRRSIEPINVASSGALMHILTAPAVISCPAVAVDTCSDETRSLREPNTTSSRDEVDLNLEVTKLVDFFQLTISRDDVDHGKPAPDCYLAAAKALSLAADECLVIEDSVTGAKAGLAAGMTTLFHPETAALVQYCPEGALLLEPHEDLSVWLEAAFS